MKLLTNRQYETLFATISAATREIQDAEEKLLSAVRWIAQLEQAHLENLRTIQALAATVLLVRANPEADLEADIDGILREVSDKVAIIEEHFD